MRCPDCGSSNVSEDVGPHVPPTASIGNAVRHAAEGDGVDVTRACWECGWRESRHLVVDEIEETSGDEDVIARMERLQEINDELEELSTEALDEALADVRRLRDARPSTPDGSPDE